MSDLNILVDQSDEWLLRRYAWYVEEGRRSFRIVRHTKIKGRQCTIPISRQILGYKEGFIIDHIDGNPCNNRRSNLRYCTIAENNRNSKLRKSASGMRGIRETPYGKWTARLKIDGKVISKTFADLKDAIDARKAMEREYFKEFARAD